MMMKIIRLSCVTVGSCDLQTQTGLSPSVVGSTGSGSSGLEVCNFRCVSLFTDSTVYRFSWVLGKCSKAHIWPFPPLSNHRKKMLAGKYWSVWKLWSLNGWKLSNYLLENFAKWIIRSSHQRHKCVRESLRRSKLDPDGSKKLDGGGATRMQNIAPGRPLTCNICFRAEHAPFFGNGDETASVREKGTLRSIEKACSMGLTTCTNDAINRLWNSETEEAYSSVLPSSGLCQHHWALYKALIIPYSCALIAHVS